MKLLKILGVGLCSVIVLVVLVMLGFLPFWQVARETLYMGFWPACGCAVAVVMVVGFLWPWAGPGLFPTIPVLWLIFSAVAVFAQAMVHGLVGAAGAESVVGLATWQMVVVFAAQVLGIVLGATAGYLVHAGVAYFQRVGKSA